MKRTVATLALAAASTSFGRPGPGVSAKTVCFTRYENESGAASGRNCDETSNNKRLNRQILANGCAKGQTAVTAVKHSQTAGFNVEVYQCPDPNMTQL